MEILKHTGRIVFALPFLVFGINHFRFASMLSGLVPHYIPGGVIWVYITGAGLIAASVSLLINKFVKVSGLLLALLLLSFVLTIHLPGLSNPQMAQMAMAGLLKDTSMMGAAIMASAFFGNWKKQ
ncbi:MAG: DoxX family membrane protein [Ignavibacteriae bacterium]|nr:DoxX family membrane protein [Ignavibacteriota bacterium]